MNNKISPVKKMTFSSLLIVLSIILTRLFSAYIPFAGVPFLRIGLGTIPVIVGGLILGPIYGGIIGGIADVVGLFIFPNGAPWFFGFTLSAILQGVIPPLIFIFTKKLKDRGAMIGMASLFLITHVILIVFAFTHDYVVASKIKITFDLTMRLLIIFIPIIYAALIFVLIYYVNRYLNKKNMIPRYSHIKISLAVLLNEFLIIVILGALWKQLFYGIPFIVTVFIQLLVLFFNFPLKFIFVDLLANLSDKVI